MKQKQLNIIKKINSNLIFNNTKDLNYLRGIYLLKNYLDVKDHYTYVHSINVSNYVTTIGFELGFNENEIKKLSLAGLLHDIGKYSVPVNILKKKGALLEKEFAIVKNHCEVGAELVKNYTCFKNCEKAILHHHEKFVGNGYPSGLQGVEIPIMSRIIAVADSFDAMTTNRPYQKAMSINEAVDQLVINTNTQFDPVIVQAFLSVLKRNMVMDLEVV